MARVSITGFLLPILIMFMSLAHAQKGKLFIIGGGERSSALIADLVKTSELRSTDYIVILPMATSVPEESIAYISEQISEFSNNKIVSFNFSKEQANNNTNWIDSVKNARLIYVTGGDQNKFMEIVRDSKLYEAMHEAYRDGATISGTSAGAAIMSKVMITGSQKQDSKSDSFREIKADYVEVSSGMGFLKNVIIDQHFIIRSRYNRLLSVLYDHSDKTVVGIDEGTALVVSKNKARISGDSQVLVVNNPKNKKNMPNGKVSFQQANLSIYVHGQEFKLKN
ncbi:MULTISPECIES: cyanophycinase [Sphingobacterium]|uniref:Cyanophycinase n=1 Tax=Sphingobacterium litopenaei TaxID=2763500 RepID=A0ABR7YCR2_9SPHI|nr:MULTISPECIES: cyanophycinase [Sphingobacterium]MBD1429097.1 cyanophycinase [Sphingobacterium litopenaei]NGM73869.1 cyanophycinase [Sphingobacterium sp. SGL-16]